jgi:hypothetical protein
MEILTFVVSTGTLVAVVVLAVFVIRMSKSLAMLGGQLSKIRTSLHYEFPVAHGRDARLKSWGYHLHTLTSYGFFTIWEWRESEKKWVVASLVPPGFDPGAPPSHTGAFDGDHVKKFTPGEKP